MKISLDDILEHQEKYGRVLPNAYVEFLLKDNGVSIDGGILIYGLDELDETNQYLQINEYAKGYIAIGDDGGGRIFLMRQEAGANEVYIVGTADYNTEECHQKVENFSNWWNDGFPIKDDDNAYDDLSELVDIILTKSPKNGVKAISEIKLKLNLTCSAKELLDKTRTLPCILVEGIVCAKAVKLLDNLTDRDAVEIRKHSG